MTKRIVYPRRDLMSITILVSPFLLLSFIFLAFLTSQEAQRPGAKPDLAREAPVGAGAADQSERTNPSSSWAFPSVGRPLSFGAAPKEGAVLVGVQVSTSTLSLNTDGWYNGNPLLITVVVTNLQSLPWSEASLTLTLESEGDTARFYVLDENGHQSTGEQSADPDNPDFSDTYYAETLYLDQTLVPPGETYSTTWWVWVQPSVTSTLGIYAELDNDEGLWDDDFQEVDIPQAQIHPVVFVHGILGSMPPKNSVITQWPQPQILFDETWLDPFVGSYSPLIDNLLKMGYEFSETLFPVTYDWRQSNQISACWLRDVLRDYVPDSGGVIAPGGNLFSILTPYTAPIYGMDNYGVILAFLFFSPVDGLVTDPLGRRVGYDPATGQIVNEIPGAFYTGNGSDEEFILIPGNREGDYTITTTGTGSGSYAALAYRAGAAGVEFLGGTAGTTAPGQVDTATVTYAPVFGDLFFEDTSASGPWTAEGGWGATWDDGDAAPPTWASDAITTPLPGRPITLTLTTPLDLTTARQARLTFNTRSSLAAGALAAVELSDDGGTTWQTLGMQPTGDRAWERSALDLTPFTQPGSGPVLLRFRLRPAAPSDRWLVDDIRVEAIQPPALFGVPFEDDFEGWRRWEANGSWTWTETAAHSPVHAWHSETPGGALTLAGTFALTDVTHPQLAFWQTVAPGTTGVVEVSTDGGQTWAKVYTTLSGTEGWERATVDLSAYGGGELSLRFRHSGGGAWTVDDVTLRNAPLLVVHSLPFEDDMETPEANWRGLNGFVPTTTTAHSGVTSWGSDVPESALQLVDRLDLTDATEPVLTFWQRFDLPAGSVGTVEVSTDGGFTWRPVYTQTESLTDWTPITVDLSPYAGQEVALAFYLRQPGISLYAIHSWWIGADCYRPC